MLTQLIRETGEVRKSVVRKLYANFGTCRFASSQLFCVSLVLRVCFRVVVVSLQVEPVTRTVGECCKCSGAVGLASRLVSVAVVFVVL